MTTEQTTTKASETPEVSRWEGTTLVVVSDYRDVGGGIDTVRFQKCELDDNLATYFCAVNGDTFGLISLDGRSCIATVEHGLRECMKGPKYVTFALRSRTPSTLKNWVNKWEKRTVGPISFFDASVTA